MSLLSDYVKKEQLLKQLEEELKRMEGDQRLKSELEFKEKLEALMAEYGKTTRDVIELLNPKADNAQPAAAQTGSAGSRRKRKLKIYKNPNTGEVVETRGGNHKTLKAWKDEHGSDTVESWVVRTED
ncbi:histone-like nucleoid-structuring protein, MvaT/MvaU family [Salinicola sp. LHM]|uniref:histone-like nucleoid-structuring protein, MvaT/MvaU family n=1 Tax=Salinicola sp. LHM TaxID=3065298 RepID=UPI002ACE61EF|nr:histone-like nucleoid-structuring protein, MvaT/MvaU family [Salinicola sp. LHM]MEC8919259.1 histone-like nucleoid-structuring protein, MvaT/MvaU family [Pseudomonadota bacterium]MED5501016.1 histone-like nucleoid-structuring protein, MvaT/MvaU family [Pseudomonadota bacterium]WQH31511.1 histone-like nucleoid-structuring protein, MvaT/MvaU family [Salinicola sp. LHM]